MKVSTLKSVFGDIWGMILWHAVVSSLVGRWCPPVPHFKKRWLKTRLKWTQSYPLVASEACWEPWRKSVKHLTRRRVEEMGAWFHSRRACSYIKRRSFLACSVFTVLANVFVFVIFYFSAPKFSMYQNHLGGLIEPSHWGTRGEIWIPVSLACGWWCFLFVLWPLVHPAWVE